MKKHSVIVNDIYEQSKLIHERFGKGSDDVHYSDEGYKKLGDFLSMLLKPEVLSMKNK